MTTTQQDRAEFLAARRRFRVYAEYVAVGLAFAACLLLAIYG